MARLDVEDRKPTKPTSRLSQKYKNQEEGGNTFGVIAATDGEVLDAAYASVSPGTDYAPGAHYSVSLNDGLRMAWEQPQSDTRTATIYRDDEQVATTADAVFLDPGYSDEGGDYRITLGGDEQTVPVTFGFFISPNQLDKVLPHGATLYPAPDALAVSWSIWV